MKKFETINEVRELIDLIDDKILNLIAERKNLVIEAVKLKSKDQIVDSERIEKIIQKLSKQAGEKNLPDGLVEKLWNTMIQEFIDYERKIFDDIHKKI
tara:strand:+ start:854 stop:1147 length:294 start_codon:yes stop_codon:yes gene_type:complete